MAEFVGFGVDLFCGYEEGICVVGGVMDYDVWVARFFEGGFQVGVEVFFYKVDCWCVSFVELYPD